MLTMSSPPCPSHLPILLPIITILIFFSITLSSHHCFADHDGHIYHDYPTIEQAIQDDIVYREQKLVDDGNPKPYYTNHDDVVDDDFAAYPSYFGVVDDAQSMDPLKLATDILSFKTAETSSTSSLASSTQTFQVEDFREDGDDDTKAVEKAWDAACKSSKGAAQLVLVASKKSYTLKPIRFSGPCKSKLTVEILGTIEASNDRSDYEEDTSHWLVFDGVKDLVVQGGGTIDGQGKVWWQNSCKVKKHLAVTFYKCNNLVVKNLKIQNGQQIHVSFQSCNNVQASNLQVNSPQDSPNTDGIHVTSTKNIRISDSVIGTGDDCISIVSGSQSVEAYRITCGPGHGISIGSLGSHNSKAYVSGVSVDGAKFSGTSNGLRIKTWQGGSGSATNIKFQNIEMKNVENPIIIDQNYCDQDKPCKEEKSAVQVKDVVYKNVKGTSASEVAIKLECSKSFPCEGVVLEDVDLERGGGKGVKAVCNNVKLTQLGKVSPSCQ
ncbi:unnamed protein product [Linum perenne]